MGLKEKFLILTATSKTILTPTVFESFFNQYVQPAILLDTDAPHHTVLAVSDSFLEATQQQREGLLGQSFFEVFEKESRARELLRLRTAIKSLLATGKPYITTAYQFNFERPDGSRAIRYWNLDTRLITTAGPDGKPRKIISHTALDITDQVLVQQMQTHLLEHSELDKMRMAGERLTLQRLIDSKRVGAFTLAPVRNEAGAIADFRFRTMTTALRQQMERATGRADVELISEVSPRYPASDSFVLFCEALQTGKGRQFDYNCQTESGERWFQFTITPISNEELLVTLIDQTEIKKVQLQLEQTIAELRRTNANLEDFAYAASHDLQEPLRKIQTFSTMLHTRCENMLDAQSLALLARMQSATMRMRALIEDLLQYSRLSLSNEAFEEVCLRDLVQELLLEHADELSICGAEVTTEGLESVWGLQPQLKLLFKHLLDNALKFAHGERALQVKISGTRVRANEVGNEHLPAMNGVAKPYLRICFEDNGIGFEPEYAERVFQLFQRLHGRSETTGNGMGLPMVHKIVTNHKGVIKADGKPGEGALFTFWLPFAEDEDC